MKITTGKRSLPNPVKPAPWIRYKIMANGTYEWYCGHCKTLGVFAFGSDDEARWQAQDRWKKVHNECECDGH
jgi:hypothetical protein